jgi:ABC-type amino acid transport substrate-binding protein
MKKRGVFISAFVLLASCLFSSGPTKTLQNPRLLTENSTTSQVTTKTLWALADPSEEPYFCSIDGYQMGIFPEISALLAKQINDSSALLGKNINYSIEMLQATNYDDYQALLKTQKYDLLLNASDFLPSEYLSGYDLTTSYLSISYSKAILRNSTKTLSTIACLGENSMASVYTRSFYYSNQVMSYDTMDACLAAVKNEECYAAIINSIYAQKLQNEDIRSIYSFTKLSEGNLKVKIAVKQNTAVGLLDALDQAIKATSEDSYNAVVSRYSHFVKPTPSFLDQVYLNPTPYVLGFGSLLLVLIAIIIVFFYSSRRKAMILANREFERFITYVCQTNEAVFEVNLQTRMMNHYQMEKHQVKNITQPFSLDRDFLDKVAPEEKNMVAQEMEEDSLKALIANGGEKSFEARLNHGDGTYFWTYIIVQGISLLPLHRRRQQTTVEHLIGSH